MPSITVRQAVFADLDVLADLFNQYREFQGCASQPAAARAFLRAHFDHGKAVVFLAHEGTQAVGFAQLYPSYSSTALARVFVLNDLFVCPSGRRKGVASGLLMALPVVTALLITNIALGILTRAAPQLNLFAIGFPITLSVGFGVLILSLGHLAPILQGFYDAGFNTMAGVIRAAR